MIRPLALAPILVLALPLAGCGGRGQLRPPEGASLPPPPYAVSQPLSADQLLTPGVQARPERADELLRRSEERQDDRFDLPPGR